MEWVALVILVLCSGIGFLAIFFTTVGTLIILLGACLAAALTGFEIIPLSTILGLAILYVIGEAAEYLFTILGVKQMGASTWAALGALVGGVIGAVLGLAVLGVGVIPGTIAGLFLGAFLVEWALKRDLRQSVKAGVGGLLGRLGSILVKVVIALAMFAILARQITGV